MFPWCEKSVAARFHVVQYRMRQVGLTAREAMEPIFEAMIPIVEWMEKAGLIRKDVKRKTLTSLLWFKVILVGVWAYGLVLVGGCFAMGVISVWGFIFYEVIVNCFIWSTLYLFYLQPRKDGK